MKLSSHLLTLFFLQCTWDFEEHLEQRPPERTLWFPSADFWLFCLSTSFSTNLARAKAPKRRRSICKLLWKKKNLFCKYKTQHRQLWWELHNMIKVGKGCPNNTGGKIGIELQYRQITEGYLLMRPEGILRALISGPYFYTSLFLQ